MKIHKQHSLTQEELFEMAKPEMDAIVAHFSLPVINSMLESVIIGDSSQKCIYGRLTGECNSEEAKSFIKLHVNDLIEIDLSNPYHTAYNKPIPIDEVFQIALRSAYYETPLEQYIFPTTEEEDESEDDIEDENRYWPESYTERIENVKTYIKSKIA